MLNFRRKQILAQNQIEKMVQAKTQLECSLTEKEHQLNLLKEKLHIKNINSEEEALNVANQTNSNNNSYYESKATPTANDKSTTNEEAEQQYQQQRKQSDADNKDPNRPRFTLKELEKVLKEKNELTIKLDQTQDELTQLKNRLDGCKYYRFHHLILNTRD